MKSARRGQLSSTDHLQRQRRGEADDRLDDGKAVAIGDRLELSIELPVSLRRHFGDRDTYQARAVVCRVEPGAAHTSPRRVGARFLGAADAG